MQLAGLLRVSDACQHKVQQDCASGSGQEGEWKNCSVKLAGDVALYLPDLHTVILRTIVIYTGGYDAATGATSRDPVAGITACHQLSMLSHRCGIEGADLALGLVGAVGHLVLGIISSTSQLVQDAAQIRGSILGLPSRSSTITSWTC